MGKTHPHYEALLRKNYDADDGWLVYADWLDTEGEWLEAQRIRLAISAKTNFTEEKVGAFTYHRSEDLGRFRRLVEHHWRDWFGALSDEFHLKVEWENGFIRHAWLTSTAGVDSCGQLFACAPMRFLKTFTVEGTGTHATLEGAWIAPALTQLEWVTGTSGALAPLRGHALSALESFGLRFGVAPSPADLAALAQLDAPMLTSFSLAAAAVREAPIFTTVLDAAWFRAVRAAWLEVASEEGLNALLASTPRLERLGPGLILALPSERLAIDRARIRRLLPRAQLAPLTGPPSEDDTGPRPQVHLAPVKAPANFRTLPPWGTKAADATVGSGIRFSDRLSHCAFCGSADTRLLYLSCSRSDLNSFEQSVFEDWEYECVECGRFTACSRVSVH